MMEFPGAMWANTMTCRILVVDDSALARRGFLARPLEAAGYDVIEAVNGEQGLRACTEYTPDVIITDLLMPVMDGFQFVEALVDLGTDCPIIVASADIQEASQKRVADLQVFGFLNKPFRTAELLSLVAQATAQAHVPSSPQHLRG